MAYWLMKSEPDVFGIEHLKALPKKTDHWDGVRNYQARNMMRDDMKVGDQVFFYHSNCKPPAIVGIMEVTKEGYVDHTAFDPDEKYYDPKSNPDKPRWYMVDVTHVRDLAREIPLDELKSYPELSNMRVVQKGNRLSIMPVEKDEWDFILSIEDDRA